MLCAAWEEEELTKGRPVKSNDSAAGCVGQGLHHVAPCKHTSSETMDQHNGSLIWTSSLHSKSDFKQCLWFVTLLTSLQRQCCEAIVFTKTHQDCSSECMIQQTAASNGNTYDNS